MRQRCTVVGFGDRERGAPKFDLSFRSKREGLPQPNWTAPFVFTGAFDQKCLLRVCGLPRSTGTGLLRRITVAQWTNHQLFPHFSDKFYRALNAYNDNPERGSNTRISQSDVAREAVGDPALFTNFLMCSGPFQKPKKDKDGNDLPLVKKKPVTMYNKDFKVVAQMLKLSNPEYLGETAWRYFTDEYTVEEFDKALQRVQYGKYVVSDDLTLTHTDAFLKKLDRQFFFRSTGLTVQSERDARRELGRERAGIASKRDLEIPEEDRFFPGDRIVISVWSKKIADLAIFAITDVPGARMPVVTVIAPSFVAYPPTFGPQQTIKVPDIAKSGPDSGIPLMDEPGRLDLLCVLTWNGPWDLGEAANALQDDFYRFTTREDLDSVFNRLYNRRVEAEKAKSPLPLVLHKEIRVRSGNR